jgi:hypothetical protein
MQSSSFLGLALALLIAACGDGVSGGPDLRVLSLNILNGLPCAPETDSPDPDRSDPPSRSYPE